MLISIWHLILIVKKLWYKLKLTVLKKKKNTKNLEIIVFFILIN